MKKTPIRTRLVLAGALAAALAGGVAAAHPSSDAVSPAGRSGPQAMPPPGAGGMHGMHRMHAMHQGAEGAHGHGARRGEGHGERALMRADANEDGKLGRDELQAAHRERGERALRAFDAADTDKDGVLTAEERRAFRDSMRARSEGRPEAWRRLGPSRSPGAPAAPAPARPDGSPNPGA
jgi:hypothetical protein